MGVHVQSLCQCSQHTPGRFGGTRAECDRPAGLAHSEVTKQINAQLYYVLAMLVLDGPLKKVGNAPVGHASENWRWLFEECEPRQRRLVQALLSTNLRVQLKEPLGEAPDGFERQVSAYEDQCGKPRNTRSDCHRRIDNSTVAQHLALNDATLDTYPMDAVRSLVRASRSWNLTADGDPMDVDAMIKGEGKGKAGKGKGHEKGKNAKHESKDATDSRSDREGVHCKTEGHVARHCKKRINDEKAKAGQQQHDNSKSNNTSVKQRVAALERSS